MQQDFPYVAEYAKSGRSTCRQCQTSISQDSLRVAIMIQSPKFDGKIPMWYHFSCFFKKKTPKSTDEIKYFDQIRWEDQEKIKEKISSKGSVLQKDDSNNHKVEHAKSNRSTCPVCSVKIEKGELRLSKEDTNGDGVNNVGPFDRWYHVDCFLEIKSEILNDCKNNFDVEKCPGFNSLNANDKKLLKSKFKSWKSNKRPRKDEEPSTSSSKKQKIEDNNEEEMKAQNKLIWKVRDELEKEVNKNILAELLSNNEQYVPIGEMNLRAAVADCMVFGRLPPCPECQGQLHYSNGEYVCKSIINEWTRCCFATRDITRQKFVISKEYHDLDCLKKYKYVARTRILPPKLNPTSSDSNINPKNLLKGYWIVVDDSFLNSTNSNIDSKILKSYGCTIRKQLTKNILFLLTSKEIITDYLSYKPNILENTKKKDIPVKFKLIAQADRLKIHTVSEDIFDELKVIGVEDAVTKCTIFKDGKSKDEIVKLKKRNSEILDMLTDSQKVVVKGGSAVDPNSGLENKGHIYQDKEKSNEIYNAILGMVDIVRGTNSFYKIQLIESDVHKKWWVYRSWGRIGTNIGDNIKEKLTELKEAKKLFQEYYYQKTGNLWSERHNFVKKPYQYYPIDIDYGNDDDDDKLEDDDQKSTLPEPVQFLIKFIFDIASMKQTIKEFEIDMAKMPLGKLSKKQIEQAYQILKDLQLVLSEHSSELVQDDMTKEISITSNSLKNKLLELSTKFYTLMPHNFGLKALPLINSTKMIRQKCEMLDNLLEIEVAYTLMNQKTTDQNNNNTSTVVCEVDRHYINLQNNIQPLNPASIQWKRIKTYLENSRGATHNAFKLEIQQIFDIDRRSEKERFNQFRTMKNRVMLWHGSRRTNWAGILSQGLRIAPPEAPVTGYMFGKGIYFADIVTKSGGYCHTNKKSPVGLLLLCEVALGNIVKRTKADTHIKLKAGEDSCHGVGRYRPDPKGNEFDDDDVMYPLGHPMEYNESGLDLLYNEFIVYDVSRVRQRYLVQALFNYGP